MLVIFFLRRRFFENQILWHLQGNKQKKIRDALGGA